MITRPSSVAGSLEPVAFTRSIFKSLKAELVWRHEWHTRRDVQIALFEYINGFYNPRRKHSASAGNHPWPSNKWPLNMRT